MDEGRKRVLLIAATILASRRLTQLDGKPSPAFVSCISEAVSNAEIILRHIDRKFPDPKYPPY
jgi:hypothetical protein